MKFELDLERAFPLQEIKRQQIKKEAEERARLNRLEQRARKLLKQRARREFKKYLPQIRDKVKENWIGPENENSRNRLAILKVKVSPSGEVKSVKVFSSSDSVAFDRAVVIAVRSASPLPIPQEAELYQFYKTFRFEFGEPSQ